MEQGIGDSHLLSIQRPTAAYVPTVNNLLSPSRDRKQIGAVDISAFTTSLCLYSVTACCTVQKLKQCTPA